LPRHRWIEATEAGAYLDEYVFRYNRRRTKGVGRIAARTIALMVAHEPLTMSRIVKKTVPYRLFPDVAPEATA